MRGGCVRAETGAQPQQLQRILRALALVAPDAGPFAVSGRRHAGSTTGGRGAGPNAPVTVWIRPGRAPRIGNPPSRSGRAPLAAPIR